MFGRKSIRTGENPTLTKSDLLGGTMCVLLAVSVIAYSRPSTQETGQKRVLTASQPSPERRSQEHEQEPAAAPASVVSKTTSPSGNLVAGSSTPGNPNESAPKPSIPD